MTKYSLQARQFGMTMEADVIEATTREEAIKKFKKKHYVSRGYVINAQKIRSRKKKRKR